MSSATTSRKGLAVRVEGLRKVFRKGTAELEVLSHVDLTIEPGEQIAILGESGSGKSTLLHLLGTLDRPTAGRIWFGDREVFARSAAELDVLRNREVGFVFQFHHLLPDHDALHNVMIPALISGTPGAQAQKRARMLLEQVGLGSRLTHRPSELSGGEQQRVAIARALIQDPGLILADEPTGNLDPATAQKVFDLFFELSAERNRTLVVVTHSQTLASRLSRRLRLSSGHLTEEAP